MLRARVIPCLLLKDSGLVKTIKFKNPYYVGDPVNAVKIYNDKEVDEIIFLDITASKEGRKPPFKLISQIADECFMPFAYGGGIRTIEDANEIFRLGAEKVIINSYAIENTSFIKTLSQVFGSQSIVVSIDAKKSFFNKYEVYTYGGKTRTKLNPIDFAIKMQEFGAGELFLNSIDRDGTMEGYDIELISKVSNAVSIPVIACGGAGRIQDFSEAVKKGGASAVAIGSMAVFQGKNRAVLINFPYPDELKKVLE